MELMEKYLKKTKTTEGGCVEWQGCRSSDGYPRVNAKNGNGKLHRLAYEYYHSCDITGKVVRHSCDNPICINPEHLFVGSMTDNMADRHLRGRTNKQVYQEEVDEIKALKEGGLKGTEIAAILNMNIRRVYYILRNQYSKLINTTACN